METITVLSFSFQSTNSDSLGVVYGILFLEWNARRDSIYLQSCVFTLITSTVTHSDSFRGGKKIDICVTISDRARFAVSYLLHENAQSRKTSSAIVTSVLRYFRRGVTFRRIKLQREAMDREEKNDGRFLLRTRDPSLSFLATVFFFWSNRYKSLSLQLCINRSLRLAYQLYNWVSFFFSLSPWSFTQLSVNVHAHFWHTHARTHTYEETQRDNI